MLRDDHGSVTVEAALALAALVTVAAAMIGGLATLAAYIGAVDVAGAAARAHAIGVDYAPPLGSVSVSESGGVVSVTATVPAALFEVSATARYPTEFR
ncbi:hypothetical protein [Corynebacterium timonense]|uniref:TadE-like protein n=1 Tax=Corynebacterium timonense TaxID=441500 RepID=A0A1H1TJ13_9CORY|nr:hypothetical protein [Corynebacterium timonense]SDS60192.1 hypothetical protein SAMN04488539_1999 [Corynebacterium timonense]